MDIKKDKQHTSNKFNRNGEWGIWGLNHYEKFNINFRNFRSNKNGLKTISIKQKIDKQSDFQGHSKNRVDKIS